MSELAMEALEEQETKRPPFVVTDDRKAEWCLNQIRQKQQEKEKWKAHYDSLYATIAKEADSDIAYFEGLLREYFFQKHTAGDTQATDTKESYPLPSGKLVMRKQEPKYDQDDAILVPWLEQNKLEKFVKVKKEAKWGELKKTLVLNGDHWITEDAEVVPGVTVTPREPKFVVEV